MAESRAYSRIDRAALGLAAAGAAFSVYVMGDAIYDQVSMEGQFPSSVSEQQRSDPNEQLTNGAVLMFGSFMFAGFVRLSADHQD